MGQINKPIAWLFVLLGGFVLLPFIYWPFAAIPFEIPRVFFTYRWIELLALLSIGIAFRYKSNPLRHSPLLLLIFFLIASSISSAFGTDWMKSFWGNTYRIDGLFTLFRLAGFALIIGLVWQKRYITSVCLAIAAGSFAVSVGTISSAIASLFSIPFFPPWQGAYGFTFGQPVLLAGYLVVTLPFVYYVFSLTKKTHKPFIAGLVVVQWIAIIVTHAWGAIITAGFITILSILVSQPWKQKIKIYVLCASVFALLITGSIVGIVKEQNPMSQTAESRQRIFTKVFLGFTKRPILGWGWANVDHAFDSVDWPYFFSTDVYVDKAHSTFLEILVTTGIVGFVLYIVFLTVTIRNLWMDTDGNSLWNHTLLLALLAYIVHSQTNVTGIAEEVIFWFIIGISLLRPLGRIPKYVTRRSYL